MFLINSTSPTKQWPLVLYNSLEPWFPKSRFCSAKGLQKEVLAWPDTTHYKLHIWIVKAVVIILCSSSDKLGVKRRSIRNRKHINGFHLYCLAKLFYWYSMLCNVRFLQLAMQIAKQINQRLTSLYRKLFLKAFCCVHRHTYWPKTLLNFNLKQICSAKDYKAFCNFRSTLFLIQRGSIHEM